MSSSVGISQAKAVALAIEDIPAGPPPAATCASTVNAAATCVAKIE